MKSISQWLLDTTDSHAIQAAESLQRDFEKETGLLDKLPSHSVRDAMRDIQARGKGGELNGSEKEKVCYGYEVAESLARTYAKWQPWQSGLGFRWRSAIEALEKIGM